MVMHASVGQLVCCNQPMTLLEENTTDAAQEKHVPVVEKTTEGWEVTVGSVEHPMQDDHYIEWVELHHDDHNHIAFLKPGQKPEAVFPVQADQVSAREFCNLHGLWKKG
jgi:superoxide reductase